MNKEQEVATEQEKQERSLPEKEEVLFVWNSPVRPFKRRDKEFFTTVGALAVLIALIMFFIGEFLAIAVVFAVVFLVYVLSAVPPEDVEHRLTNKGIIFAGKKYKWEELVRFWFTQRFGNDLLVVERLQIPNRIELVVKSEEKQEIQQKLEKYLLYEEAAPNFLDKIALWLSNKVPVGG